jgi:hypothetical protein
MKRADFLKVMGAGALTSLAGTVLTACKSSSTTPTNPANKTFTSTSSVGHSHTITIQRTEVDTPPSAGISRETSANGHTHTFTMSAAELTTVRGGAAVTVTTADSNGHTHDFVISKWY